MSTITRPGSLVVLSQSNPNNQAPSDTGTAFVMGVASQGPSNRAILCQNIDEVTATFGARIPAGQSVPTSPLWDWCDVAFKMGVQRIWVGRLAGPAAAPASFTFQDSVPANAISVNTNGPGPTTMKAAIVAGTVGSTVQIVVLAADGVTVLDQSPNLTSNADAVNWAQYGSLGLVTVTAIGALLPAVHAAAALAGGSDDHASITDTIRIAALPTLFPRQLGPGQVASPGGTTAAIHAGLSDYCAVIGNRVALLDGPDTAVVATAVASLTGWQAATTQPLSETFGILSSPWRAVPGVGSPYARIVPPSAAIAGIIATSDAATGNPNQAAAGANGIDNYSLGSSQVEWSDADRTTLNAAGIACFTNVYNQQQLYGFRSGAYSEDVNAASYAWQSFAASRLRMALENEFYIAGGQYLFDQLDGQGLTIAEFNGAVTAILLKYYDLGALYGATSADAFAVDTGPSVNTPTTIENQELHCKCGIKVSPFNELSYFEMAKVALTEVLAA